MSGVRFDDVWKTYPDGTTAVQGLDLDQTVAVVSDLAEGDTDRPTTEPTATPSATPSTPSAPTS